MTRVAFSKEPCKTNQLVPWPTLRRPSGKMSWRRYLFADSQLSDLLPSAEGSERVIRRSCNPISQRRPHFEDWLCSVRDHVNHAARSELSVVPQRVDVKWPGLFEQLSNGCSSP